MKRVLNKLLKGLSFICIILVFLVTSLYFTILLITHGPSESARNLFTTTMLETGALKWMVGLVLDKDTVQEIVNKNSLIEMKEEVNSDLINTSNTDNKEVEPIEIKKVNGSNYSGTMMIVHDPSRIKVESTYPFSEHGVTLKRLVEKSNSIGGINGGLYLQNNGKGGYPAGVLVQNSQIVWNRPNEAGLMLIGLNTDNILKILSLDGLSTSQIEELVKKEKIRDAVSFQEEASDANNHFVKLIVNGEVRQASGNGSGANPRSAIGQTADGSILLFVTDGRGANGHLGATASDLIQVMKEFNAINAANIDGGSSSCMYYNGEYLMSSTTFYYQNSSWEMPDAFVVSR